MPKFLILIILILTLYSCSTMDRGNYLNARGIASIKSKGIKHKPFFKILFDKSSQDTRLSKVNTMKLIDKSSNKDCAEKVSRKIAAIFMTQTVKSKIDQLYFEHGVEIHLGGIYQDNGQKIRFDQIVQAHVPNTNYHKSNQYIYQVRSVGTKIPDRNEEILDSSSESKIEFPVNKCEISRINESTYLKMLSRIEENVEDVIKELNQGKIEESPFKDLLMEHF